MLNKCSYHWELRTQLAFTYSKSSISIKTPVDVALVFFVVNIFTPFPSISIVDLEPWNTVLQWHYHFSGGIYLLNVNNKLTRAKFFTLQQSFTQRFVHVCLTHIFFVQHKFTKSLKIFVKVREPFRFYFWWPHLWKGVWRINPSYSNKNMIIFNGKFVHCFKNKQQNCKTSEERENVSFKNYRYRLGSWHRYYCFLFVKFLQPMLWLIILTWLTH